jgi:hypothetical protein
MYKSAGLVLVGFLAGAATAAIWTFRTGLPAQSMSVFLLAQELETQSYLRYRFGGEDVAAKSLEAYVDLLQRDADLLRPLQPNWFNRRLGLAYVRLALLAERSEDESAGERYFDLARMQFAIVGSSVTRDELREMARGADENWDREMKETPALPQSEPSAAGETE